MFDVLHVNLPERMAVECGKNISSEMSLQEDQDEIQSGPAERPNSPRSSCVSFKSDQSMVEPLTLKEGSAPPESGHAEMPNPPGSSCMSYKSDHSMGEPLNLKEESAPPERTKARSSSRGSSFVSFKSDQSIKEPPTFQEGLASQERESAATSAKLQKKIKDQLKDIFHELEKRICEFIKQELEIYRKHLTERTTKTHDNVKKDTWTLKQGALNMTQYFLKKMEHDDLAEALQDEMTGIQQHALKSKLSEKCRHVCEGIAQQGESTLLNKIYTDLYITEGGAGQVNKEHEVRLIQKNNVNRDASQLQQEAQIECKNMFDLLPGQEKNIRTVLTQGVAGIGKSICVQKFILDWAAGEGHQDIQFIFPLPFRELNLKKGRQSLMDIICFFFPETEGLRLTDQNRIMFILDGLDECQHPLVFQKNESLNDVCKSAPLDVVLTNLIKGNLLPSALIWITTRPAAASRIPAEHVHRMTELRGFNNQQKEEYFRKRISDENLATKIIEHIKESRSLFIMCHIPVFCWISAKVLLRILEETESGETPKTLTEMYTCFLIFQAVQGNLKYSGKNVLDVPWDKEAILSLGKLSFQHLEESNLIFNIEDLEACGVDPSKISVYSGLCTQETVRFLGTVFSFVHLSIQEFLTAVFAYLSLRNDLKNVFDQQSTSVESKTTELTEFLKTAVDKALKSDHGHLDLFLRFLLGLSLESNEKLIRGLLTQSGSRSDCRKEIVEYIKLKFKDNLSPERSINLFYCLNELNDDSLVKDIQSHMSSGSLSEAKLSPAQWSALVFVLLTSKEKLEVFDLQKFIRSEECLNRLLPVVQEATTALLSECNLTERSCSALLQVLSSESSNLTLLDLSNNPIQDLGVELLSEGLRSPACKLETLRLSECNLTERSCSALLQVLSSESSNLTLLDLSNNPIQDLGVERLSEGLNNFNYKLETLGLSECNLTERSCSALLQVLSSESSNLTLLDLSNNPIQDLGVELLSEGLRSPACKLETLRLSECNLTERSCSALLQVLSSESSNLTLLDLSNNPIQDLGVELLSEGLRSPACKLETLSLSSCSITGKGYTYLASALESNSSSPLTELDLRGNDPGDTGVKKLTDLVKNPKWKLNKLGLLKSSAAEKLCDHLTEALGINPLLLTELDLSGRIQGDSEMKKLSDLLEDSHCRTQILKLKDSDITEEGSSTLLSALCLNPSHLRELDLSGNKIGDSGLKKICALLNNPSCKLQMLRINDDDLTEESCSALATVLTSSTLTELDLSSNNLQDSGVKELCSGQKDPLCKLKKLSLSFCRITEGGYAALASALKSSSSALTELDLRGNDPGDTGVKQLTGLFMNTKKILRLLKSDAAEEAYTYFKQKLGKDPLLQTELDLSQTEPKEIRVNQLSALLEDPHCRLQKLTMYKSSSITVRDCADLISALTVNPSHLRELDLIENKLDQAGLQKLCDLLKNPHCRLEKLSLRCCCISEEGYAALASALNLNTSSPLMELDLRGNDPGDKGVKLIMDLEKDSQTKGRRIRLLKSSAAEELCDHLTEALGTNPLLLTELDLSGRIQGDSEMKQLSDLLKDSHCRPEKIKLNNSRITEEGCAALSAALSSNPSHLKELDLSGNKLGNPGVKQICNLLKILDCRLAKLNLSDCSVTQEGYKHLASALKSNPSSHLTELDLRGNDPGDTGVKKLTDLVEDSNCKLKTLRLLKTAAAEEAWTSLSSALRINILLLTELKLSRNPAGPSGDSRVKLLCAVLQDTHCKLRRLWINDDDLTEESCSALATVLTSSTLTELDLSSNNLQDSGVKELCSGLKDPLCKLKKLSLSFCRITEGGYAALASALESSSSALTELDLRGNDPGDTGVKQLTGLFMNTKKKLRLLKSNAAEEAYTYFKQKLGKDPLLQTELDLSQTEPKKIRVDQLSALLEDPHCRLQKLTMYKSSSITERDCADLISALTVNPSHLRELDLKENKLDQAGLQKLCDLLKNSHCRLEKLSLRGCCLSGEGYEALASALKSNPSSVMTELDLRGNDPGETGVRLFTDLQNDPRSKLKTLRLLKSSAAEEVCDCLNKALGINPLLLTELDLSGRIQGDSEMKKLCDLLEDSHCRTQKLKLNNNSITEEGCATLSKALCSNYPHLKELDLSGNKLGNSGVKHVASLLRISDGKVEKLNISDCGLTEGGYAALASALKSNPSSSLKELDLRGNDPGDTGVKQLWDLKEDSKCNLNTLRVLKSSAAEKLCDPLTEALGINPLLQTELDLSGRIQGDSEMKKLSDLLEDSHCRTQKLKLNNSSVTEEGCAALSAALSSNPSHLKELDLSENKLGNPGVKQICNLLTNQCCKLQRLRLSFCSVTGEGYAALASALKSNGSSPLMELDLRGNDPGDAGVELIRYFDYLSKGSKKTLRLLKKDAADQAYTRLKQILQKNPLVQTELDLSKTDPKQIQVQQLSALLEDPHCRLQKLTMYKSSSITERDCADLISALTVNPSHLRELDLNENKLDQAGLQKLCDLLKNPHCRLKKLSLRCCCISEEGYAALASALKLNTSSPLMELDLRGNDPGDKGVKLIMDLEKDSQTTGRRIRLLKSSAAEKLCDHLTGALGTNPLLLRELDLSGRIQGDSEMKQLSDLLKDSHCRPEKIKLNNSSITEEGCAVLSAALSSNPSHLKELDLSENKLGNPGVKKICDLLKILDCRLAKLNLSDCSVTQEGYEDLASALKSNPSSHLTELDLRGNDPGDSGVKKLTDLVEDSNCKLKTLRLLKTAAAEEAWTSLSSALGINILLQTELKLSRNSAGPSGDSRVKLLCAVLQDTHCKLRRLRINDDDLTEESCSALATVLTSSTLTELDLSSNNLQDSGVKELCSGLKDPLCKLKKLSLSFCRITEGGYAALASALKSSSSALTELDLRGNDPGDTGVKQLTGLFVNTKKKLRLLKSDAAKEAYTYFKRKLGKDPLLQMELDLSKTEPKEIRVDQLSALLEDPHCRLQKLTMYKSSSITERDCADLISALTVNPSHLRELDLKENKLGQAGLQKLCDLLKNPHCRLEKLRLVQSLTEGGCADLASALYTNPSHIRELDLSLNKLGASGVKQLCRLVENQKCELQKLQLKKCSIEEDGCAALTSALSSNPSHLRELDLRENKLGKSVEQLSELMKKSGCSLRLDPSLLKWFTPLPSLPSWFWGNTDKPQHSANQEKPEEDDEVGEQDGAGQCNRTSEQTAGEQGGAGQCNRTSEQTAGERGGAGQCNRTSEQTAGERDGAGQCNRTSVQTAGERGGAGQCNRTSVQTAGERGGAGQCNRTSVQTAGERGGAGQCNRTSVQTAGERGGAGQCNRTSEQTAGERGGAGQCNRTSEQTAGERGGAGQCNWISVQTAGERGGAGQCNRTSVQTAGERGGAGQCNRTSVQTARERGGAGQCNRTSEQTAGERGGAGQCNWTSVQTAGERGGAGQGNWTSVQTAGEREGACQGNRTSVQTAGERDGAGQCNRTSVQTAGERDGAGQCNRTSEQTAGERGGAGQCNRISVQTAGERGGAGQGNRTSVQTAGERGGAGQCNRISVQTAGERDRAGQCNRTSEQTAGERGGAGQCNRTSVQTAGERGGAGQCNRTSEQTAGERGGAGQCNWTSVQTAGERGGAGQGNRTSVQTAGKREGAYQGNRTSGQTAGERDGVGQDEQNSLQTAGERDGAGQCNRTSGQTAGERDGAGQCNRTSVQTAGERGGAGQCNRTSVQTAGERGGAGQCNRTSVQTAGERDRAGQDEQNSEQTAGERDGAGQCNRTSVQTAGERGGAGQCNRTSVQTAGERDGAGQDEQNSEQTAGERDGAGQDEQNSGQTAGEREGAYQGNRTSGQTAGERDGAGQCNRTSVQTAGERDGAGQCNRTSEQTAGERGGAGQCNRTSEQTAGERDGSSCHKNKKKQQKKSS
ncbi:uncharacterized protein [Salminus brasiliensis]|uniref:uncharacterized protein isoform X2 n=1 Tax=Salminus brasiliensis TaxID=930266 RepID=UPI003B83A2D8